MPDWLNYNGIDVPDATPSGSAGLKLKDNLIALADRSAYYSGNGNDSNGTNGLALGSGTTASGDSSTVVGRSSRIGFVARTFSCSANGTTITISGNVTSEFANGETVLINPNVPLVASTVTRTISSVAFGSGNTTFTISSAIDATTTGGSVVSTSKAPNGSAFGNGIVSLALNGNVGGQFNFLNSGSMGGVAYGLLNNQQTGVIDETTGAVSGTPAAFTSIGLLSTAVGINNRAQGTNAVAIGRWNFCPAVSNVAIGIFNNQTGGVLDNITGLVTTAPTGSTGLANLSTAIGIANRAGYGTGGLKSSAIGYANTAGGTNNSSAVGSTNTATGNDDSAFGYSNATSGWGASAFGNFNAADGANSSALGHRNTSAGDNSTAAGNYNTLNAASLNCHLFGGYNFGNAASFASVALGLLNNAQGDTLNTSSGAISGSITADTTIGRLGTAVGIQNAVSGNSAGAFGYSNIASASNSWSIGASVNNSTSNSVEIGPDNTNKVRVDSNGLNVLAKIVTEKAGNSSATAKLGGPITVNTSAVGNVGTGEDNLITYTVPASVLNTNGDRLEITAAGTFAANANNKTLKLKFGATTLYNSTALAANGGSWFLSAMIIRTGATAQKAIVSIVCSNALIGSSANYTTPAETLSGTVVLKCTGEATSNNDVVQETMTVNWFPANT